MQTWYAAVFIRNLDTYCGSASMLAPLCAGGGINLRLLPNMRIVIEMDGTSTPPGVPSSQPLMTVEKCAQIAQASIAAAQAAQAAVRNGPQQ